MSADEDIQRRKIKQKQPELADSKLYLKAGKHLIALAIAQYLESLEEPDEEQNELNQKFAEVEEEQEEKLEYLADKQETLKDLEQELTNQEISASEEYIGTEEEAIEELEKEIGLRKKVVREIICEAKAFYGEPHDDMIKDDEVIEQMDNLKQTIEGNE